MLAGARGEKAVTVYHIYNNGACLSLFACLVLGPLVLVDLFLWGMGKNWMEIGYLCKTLSYFAVPLDGMARPLFTSQNKRTEVNQIFQMARESVFLRPDTLVDLVR